MTRITGTRISEEWKPSEKDLLVAQPYQLGLKQLAWLRERFIDIFTNPDCRRPVKKDWHRTWKNFLVDEAPRAKRHIKESLPITPTEVAAENIELWRARMRGWQKNGQWPAFAGPKPNEARNYIPRAILIEFGLLKEEGRPQVAARPSGTCNV